MNDVRENVRRVTDARAKVQEHPMCGRMKEDAGRITVLFPCGDFPVDGLTIQSSGGKVAALQVLLERMEQVWMESYPSGAFA